MFRAATRNLGMPLRRALYVGGSGSLLLSGGSLLHAFGPNSYLNNDSVIDVKQRNNFPEELGLPSRVKVGSQQRRANYRQMCYGSILGLVFGVIFGKISSLLVFITGFGFVGLQFLQNRGVISSDSTRSLSKYAVTIGREKVDLNTLIWEKPSFKVSFILTFVLAALNV
ncbi:unnamed protein product [Kluyveromyces dobzhanskii CBS 2104]|uniref:WGS project CCBQ000000000 data, contig 00015 n=1 Tax=Kluyveromyces dobzhanskii CBS 2104 TaxID=1427455 RepID=A0A0A8L9Y3_9SACH|nr:unnamed protein product [Kluyveromyces dobzhanskii CBS 2104]